MESRDIKVLHVEVEPGWRGGQRQALLLAKKLVERGVNVLFAAPRGSEMLRRVQEEELPFWPLRTNSQLNPIGIWGLHRAIARFRPDIVHLHSSRSHGLGVVAAKLFGKERPKIVVHRRVDVSPRGKGVFNSYKYGAADLYIAISRRVASSLEGFVPKEKIVVVYSGVEAIDTEPNRRERIREEFGIKPDEPLIGSVGALVEHKDFVTFVSAAKIVVSERPEAKFIIFGEGPERQKLEHAIEQVGLQNFFILAGFREQAPEDICAFDIFVLPSSSEGLGTSALDAMNYAIPVIASDSGGLVEIIEHGRNGLLFSSGDSKKLSEMIVFLINDKSRRFELGRRAQNLFYQKFTSDRMADEVLYIYKSRVLGRKP